MSQTTAHRRVRLRDLETLLAVVEAGGMRKAAAVIALSQPAVSKAMAELEDAVGVKLLERSRRGVEPTPFGRALARRAEVLVDGVRGAIRELAEMADPEGGEVRFGAMETLVNGVVGATAADLLMRHPRLRLVFESGQAPDLIGHFLIGRLVDFVVARPYSPALPPDVKAEPLFHDRLFVVCASTHSLARRRRLAWSDVHAEGWVLSRNEYQPDGPVAIAFAAHGLGLPQRIVTSGSLALRFNLLEHNRFLTCVPHSVLPFLDPSLALRVLPLDIAPWKTATMIMTLRDRMLSPAAELFLARLRERAKPLDANSPESGALPARSGAMRVKREATSRRRRPVARRRR